jgi:cell division protein FtsW (lipid II flippase)
LVSGLAALLMLSAWGLLYGIDTYSLPAIWVAITLCWISTIVAYSITSQSLDKSTKQFMNMLMTGMMIKMFIGLISIVVVGVRFKEVRSEYVVAYLIAYFALTGFEVYALMSKLRRISNKGAN